MKKLCFYLITRDESSNKKKRVTIEYLLEGIKKLPTYYKVHTYIVLNIRQRRTFLHIYPFTKGFITPTLLRI